MSDLPCFRFFLVGLLETTSVFSAVLREVHWTRLTGIFTDRSLTLTVRPSSSVQLKGGLEGIGLVQNVLGEARNGVIVAVSGSLLLSSKNLAK